MSSQNLIQPGEIVAKLGEYQSRYVDFKTRGLKLDMTRGKPSAEQLDLADVGFRHDQVPARKGHVAGRRWRLRGAMGAAIRPARPTAEQRT